MSMTWLQATDTIRRARNQAAGKPLARNTRLYVRGEGDEREYGIVLHGTEVVTIHSDGTYTLRNGGWNTPTTLDRIRGYAPVSWQTLITERGEWFVRLKPNPADPRPENVNRQVPRPYEAVNPGDEPVKSTEGCVAGQLVTTNHIDEIVELMWRKNMKESDELVEVVEKSTFRDDDEAYDRVKVKRSWNDHVYIGEAGDQWGWDEGWANLADNRSGHSRQFTNDDGETVTYVQCSHCKEFDAAHERWRMAMYGVRYGRSFDQQTGYATYAEMMECFGNREAWQEAYITDFRARRAYLKADREWDQRNRVPFYDGIVVDSEGYTPRLRQSGPSPAKLRRHEAAVAKMKKRIDKYVDGFVKELRKGTMPMPSGGDCWYCCMFDAVAPNELGSRLHQRGTTVEPGDTTNSEHLDEHMKERYYVPSLAVNALREAGYQDTGIFLWLDMSPETETMGGKDNGRKPYDTTKRALRKYLAKRLVPAAPTK